MKIAIVGDVMLGGILSSNFEKYKNISLSHKIRKLLEADITFCNLECPIARIGDPITHNKILLYAQEKSIELLKTGFNAVSLANNHIMDFGSNSLLKTIKLLEEKNIKHVCAGQNLFEARKPIFFNKNGLKVVFLAYVAPETWGGWSQRKEQTHKILFANKNKAGVAPFNLNYIKEDISKIKNSSDFIVISIHWGDEYTYFPNPEIISDAHKIIDFGANLVVGHHPHVLQGYEEYHSGLIMYSLSNFLFSPYFDDKSIVKIHHKSRIGAILQCNITKNKILNHKLVPTLQKKKEPIVINPSSKTKNKILRKIQFLSSEYQKDNYQTRYIKLKEKENRFKHIRLILETIEMYGLVYLFKKIWILVFRNNKNRKV